jgi:hypothetical protein
MKIIYKDNLKPWIISKNESHPDVEDCVSVIVPNDFNLVKERLVENDEEVIVYKTLEEVQTELS